MGRKQEVFSDSTSFLVLLYIPELTQHHNNLLHISGVLHESPKQRQRAGCRLGNMPNRGEPSHLLTSAFIFNSRNEPTDNTALAVAKMHR